MSRYEELADDLRRKILSGQLEPGTRLPTEPDLSTRYGVSRSTVREALRVLSSQNLVETVRGVTGGTFVALPKTDDIQSYLENSLGLLTVHDEVPIQALLEARDLLEVPAAGLAAQRADAAALENLRDTLVDPTSADTSRIQACNHRFHALLVTAAGNPLLEVITRPVFAVLVQHATREAVDAAYWEQVIAEHRDILDAVEAHDSALAEELMRVHLDHLRATYARAPEGAGAGSDPEG